MNATIECTKVAWIRDASAPAGSPASGRLNCRCGNAPVTWFNASQGNVRCACGKVYSWDGWRLKRFEFKSVRVFFEDGSSYATDVNGASSDDEIREYFVGQRFDRSPVLEVENFKTCVRVEISNP